MDVIHLAAVRTARAALPSDEAVADLAEMLSLASNPTRLKMLLALVATGSASGPLELCVCDLATVTGASKSMTSHQLRLLRTAGLVTNRREGKLTFYSIVDGPALALLSLIQRLAAPSPPERPAARRAR